jgi:hypothetical protein
MSMCCALEICFACDFDLPSLLSAGMSSRGPPSRLTMRWTFVSFVSRFSVAVLAGILAIGGCESVQTLLSKVLSCDVENSRNARELGGESRGSK